MNNKTSMAKILVEIASYKDPELLNTINSALVQADNPNRVYFSICYQGDDLEVVAELKRIKNCKFKHLWAREARGSCYARYLCQKMIDDEEYIFQTDSHMRFVKHWDNKLIEELLSLNDPKACISFYPPNCTEEMMLLPFDDEVFDSPANGGIMYTKGFADNSLFISNCSFPIDNDDTRAPAKNPFISAGNFFSFSQIHRDILHDPEMYFYGDEMPMAIRYYTHGWNNYTNNKSYVYHQYCRKNQSFPKVDNNSINESLRFKRLLNLDNADYDMGQFGLGNIRTLKQFEAFAGINYSKRIIYKGAEEGNFTKDKMDKVLSSSYKNRVKKIEVLIIDIRDDLIECIKSFYSKKSGIHNISFIVGTTSKRGLDKEFINNYNIKEIVYFPEDTIYSQILSTLIPKLSNSYTMLIDSAVRALSDWDNYSCENIDKCGTRGALTNWVWKTDKDIDWDTFGLYNNVIKELDRFYNYLPIYRYNLDVILENRDNPYKTPFISDGFLFIKSSIIKKIKLNPELRYEEQKYLLSIKLFTEGINIYYPSSSCFYRVEDEESLNAGENHYELLFMLFKDNVSYDNLLDNNYIGKERPLWEWYEYIGYNDSDN